MGEVLTQVWLKSIAKWVSYLTRSECTKREFEKTSGVHASSPRKPTKKCAMKMKEINKETNKKKKRRARKNVIDGRKHYIGHLQKTGEKD